LLLPFYMDSGAFVIGTFLRHNVWPMQVKLLSTMEGDHSWLPDKKGEFVCSANEGSLVPRVVKDPLTGDQYESTVYTDYDPEKHGDPQKQFTLFDKVFRNENNWYDFYINQEFVAIPASAWTGRARLWMQARMGAGKGPRFGEYLPIHPMTGIVWNENYTRFYAILIWGGTAVAFKLHCPLAPCVKDKLAKAKSSTERRKILAWILASLEFKNEVEYLELPFAMEGGTVSAYPCNWSYTANEATIVASTTEFSEKYPTGYFHCRTYKVTVFVDVDSEKPPEITIQKEGEGLFCPEFITPFWSQFFKNPQTLELLNIAQRAPAFNTSFRPAGEGEPTIYAFYTPSGQRVRVTYKVYEPIAARDYESGVPDGYSVCAKSIDGTYTNRKVFGEARAVSGEYSIKSESAFVDGFPGTLSDTPISVDEKLGGEKTSTGQTSTRVGTCWQAVSPDGGMQWSLTQLATCQKPTGNPPHGSVNVLFSQSANVVNTTTFTVNDRESTVYRAFVLLTYNDPEAMYFGNERMFEVAGSHEYYYRPHGSMATAWGDVKTPNLHNFAGVMERRAGVFQALIYATSSSWKEMTRDWERSVHFVCSSGVSKELMSESYTVEGYNTLTSGDPDVVDPVTEGFFTAEIQEPWEYAKFHCTQSVGGAVIYNEKPDPEGRKATFNEYEGAGVWRFIGWA
jgi:hypothetical protein